MWYLDASLDLFSHLNDRLLYTTCEAACIHYVIRLFAWPALILTRAMFELVVIIYELRDDKKRHNAALRVI